MASKGTNPPPQDESLEEHEDAVTDAAAKATGAGKTPPATMKKGTGAGAEKGATSKKTGDGQGPKGPSTSGGGTGGTGGDDGAGGGRRDGDGRTPADKAPKQGVVVKELVSWASRMCRDGIVRLNDSESSRIMREFGKFQLSQADREAAISKVAYQGFDPIKTLHQTFILKETRGKTDDVFMKDIYHMCLIFLTRGTNLANMTKRMSTEGVAMVEGLIQDYNLKKGQAPPNELTLSRVALTYYSTTVIAAHTSAQHLPIKPSYMATISPGYPPALMTQAIAAAIPIDKSYSMTLIHAHCLYLIEFAKLINPRMKMQGDTVVLESCLPALRKRNPESLADHLWLLEEVGLIHRPVPDQPEVVTDAVVVAAQTFRGRHGSVYII
ncbi:hypothetical protein HPB51_004691 [Rhipicephalus microplus]|uniref:Nucleoprotein n=1 Tax=Rhipicephalus microplus TaxID=6941 RepID=A0A9J6DYP9_RHIMP|nr:hypothetical protein HPB51_004691 [Rhipicephalus microplus]